VYPFSEERSFSDVGGEVFFLGLFCHALQKRSAREKGKRGDSITGILHSSLFINLLSAVRLILGKEEEEGVFAF